MTDGQAPLRVTLVVGVFPALSETFVLDQVVYLLERGHDVRIVAFETRAESAVHDEVSRYGLLDRTRYLPRPRSKLEKFRLISTAFRAAGAGFLKTALDMRRARRMDGEVGYITTLAALVVAFAEQGRPHVFLCHFGQNGSLALRAVEALRWRVPVATIFHGFDLTMLVKQNGQRIYRHLLSKGALFLPACDYFAALLLKLGAPSDRVMVQRMCVSIAKLDKLAESLPHRPGTHPFTFISIGRLVEKKGHAILLAAFQRAFDHVTPGEVQLVIIGDGELRPVLDEAARLNQSIHALGALSRVEILSQLMGADVAVQPSLTASDGDMESMPLVISEAMALQKPVIATRHAGIPELVLDGVTGVLADERDEMALAEAMRRMRSDRGAAQAMGIAGRRRLEENFDAGDWNALLEERLNVLADKATVHLP